jgi:conjugal transfer/entry exclusion protein
MTTHVLTQEELQEIKNFQDKRRTLIQQFGIIEFNIQDLESQKQQLTAELNNLKQLEIQIGSKLQDKYGEGTIDIDKGEFTSNS